jgi:hypothetical protein
VVLAAHTVTKAKIAVVNHFLADHKLLVTMVDIITDTGQKV